MSGRARVVAFTLLAAVCSLGAVVAIATAMRGGEPAEDATEATRSAIAHAERAGRPVVVFRTLKPGRPEGEGQMAVAAPGSPPAERTREPLRCDRGHFAAGRGICLARSDGFAEGYEAQLFDREFRVREAILLDGVPSRARVSPDGRYGTVTMFVTGHSYANAGAFSTQTTLLDLARGTKLADLEEFAVMRGGRRVTAIDVNFWGVTFARDSDRFFATMASGGKTYLIEGSVRSRTARVLRENVECPSLSPDGTRIAYKHRTGSRDTPWRLSVLDLATLRDTPLAETRSVDDQAEWLDDGRVLYGIDDAIWVVPADGSGAPRRFMADADSPAVLPQ